MSSFITQVYYKEILNFNQEVTGSRTSGTVLDVSFFPGGRNFNHISKGLPGTDWEVLK